MQKIGLEAVMMMANFNKGQKEYVSGTKEMEDKTSSLGGILGKLGGGLETVAKVGAGAAIAGIGALTGILYSSVRAASEAQKVEAQLDQVLKSTGGAAGMTKDEILNLANALSQVTPFEDEVIIGAETMLLQFKNIGEEVFPQATEMALDLAQRLGIDASSAAKLLGKALEEPGEGLLRLKQAGVAFTDEQEKMIDAMVKAGDTAGAQKYIMDQLEQSVGGAARAAGDTFAGKLEIMKNTMGNLQETIGAALLPALTSIATKLLEVFNNPQVQAAIQQFADWMAVNLPLAIDAVVKFIQDPLLPILSVVFKWLSDKLPGAVDVLGDIFGWLVDKVLTPLWKFINDPLIPILSDIFNWLKVEIPKAIDALGVAFKWFKDNILAPVEKAFQGVLDVIAWLVDKIEILAGWLAEVGNAIPWELIPGSPTPFELGLVGINKALKNMAAIELPGMMFQTRLMQPVAAGESKTTNTSYGGDTYYVTVQDRLAAAVLVATARSRQYNRLATGMGG